MAAAADGSVVDDAGANGTTEAKAVMTQPRLREAAQGLAVQATPRVTARLTAMAMVQPMARLTAMAMAQPMARLKAMAMAQPTPSVTAQLHV